MNAVCSELSRRCYSICGPSWRKSHSLLVRLAFIPLERGGRARPAQAERGPRSRPVGRGNKVWPVWEQCWPAAPGLAPAPELAVGQRPPLKSDWRGQGIFLTAAAAAAAVVEEVSIHPFTPAPLICSQGWPLTSEERPASFAPRPVYQSVKPTSSRRNKTEIKHRLECI